MVYYRININHDHSSQINQTNDQKNKKYILNNHKNRLVNCFFPLLVNDISYCVSYDN